MAKGTPWKVAILTKMANLAKCQKPANNGKLMANLDVKNRQSVDENLKEASRGARPPCKVVKLTKMANLGKISCGAW